MAGPTLTLGDGVFNLRAEYADRERCKQITGRKWDGTRKCWTVPFHSDVVAECVRMFPSIRVDDLVLAAVEQMRARAQAVQDAKDGGWETAVPVAPMPVRCAAFQHQVQAFSIGITIFGWGK